MKKILILINCIIFIVFSLSGCALQKHSVLNDLEGKYNEEFEITDQFADSYNENQGKTFIIKDSNNIYFEYFLPESTIKPYENYNEMLFKTQFYKEVYKNCPILKSDVIFFIRNSEYINKNYDKDKSIKQNIKKFQKDKSDNENVILQMDLVISEDVSSEYALKELYSYLKTINCKNWDIFLYECRKIQFDAIEENYSSSAYHKYNDFGKLDTQYQYRNNKFVFGKIVI